jgi:hypothetical protein
MRTVYSIRIPDLSGIFNESKTRHHFFVIITSEYILRDKMPPTIRRLGYVAALALTTTPLSATPVAAQDNNDRCMVIYAPLETQYLGTDIYDLVALNMIAGRKLNLADAATRNAAVGKGIDRRNAHEQSLKDDTIPHDKRLLEFIEGGLLRDPEKRAAAIADTKQRIAKSEAQLTGLQGEQQITITAICDRDMLAAVDRKEPFKPLVLGRAVRGADGKFVLEAKKAAP